MSSKKKELSITPEAARILKAVKATRSAFACTLLVKAAIERREQLMDYDPEPGNYKWEKFSDKKSRERTQGLVKAIMKLDDRKDVSVLCNACIAQRKECRAAGREE